MKNILSVTVDATIEHPGTRAKSFAANCTEDMSKNIYFRA